MPRFALPHVPIILWLLPAVSFASTVFVEDFETPDTANFLVFFPGTPIITATNAWDVTAGSIDLFEDAARAEAAAFDGAQAIDLTGSPGAGTLETEFATTPGAAYELTFHYARNALLGADTGDAEVDVLGTTSLLHAAIQHDPAQHAFDAYLPFSDTFIADSSVTVLRFTSLDPGNTGITIDGICVQTSNAVGVEPWQSMSWAHLKARFEAKE